MSPSSSALAGAVTSKAINGNVTVNALKMPMHDSVTVLVSLLCKICSNYIIYYVRAD